MKPNKRFLVITITTILTVLALLPLFAGKYFVSLDGSSHVYNAQLMNELLLGKSTGEHFPGFNNFPVPNATGHFVLQLLLLVFPSFLAEKILVALLIGLLPLSAARLIEKSGGNPVIALFFFPLGFSFFTGFGFYNFSVGIILLLFLLGTIVETPRVKNVSKSRIVLLLILWGSIYFSHILVFFAGLLLTGLFWIIVVFRRKDSLRQIAGSLLLYFGPTLLFLVPACLFIINQEAVESTRLPVNEIIEKIWRSDVLIAYALNEHAGTYIFSGILAVFLVFITVFLFRKREYNRSGIFYGAALLTLSALIFILPDGTKDAGFVTTRLIFLFTIAFLLFVSRLPNPRLHVWLLVPLIACQLILSARHYNTNHRLQNELTTVSAIGNHIPSGKTVLMIDLRPKEEHYWLTTHRYILLAQRKNVVIFNNYEAVQSYFPLIWDKKTAAILFDHLYDAQHYDHLIASLAPDFVAIQRSQSMPDIKTLCGPRYRIVFQIEDYILCKHC